MLEQMLIGLALIFCTICIQTGFIGTAIALLDHSKAWASRPPQSVKASIVVGATALWLMVAHLLAVWLWAIAFLAVDIFEDIETSVYFSGVAFTTLGFGDIIPPEAWRQLAGLCATNGLLVFGVSTAFLADVLRRLREA